MKITILGQTPAQKNSKQMAMNRSTGKMFPVSSKIVKEWQTSAAKQLADIEPLDESAYPVAATVLFYVKDNVQRDMDNMLSSVQDALVKAGIIKKDCWQLLRPITIDVPAIDKDNPRAVVWLDV